MSAKDEYREFCKFVLENDVANQARPVLFDREDETYVIHHSRWPDIHFEKLNQPPIMVNFELFYFVKKKGGFQPEVVGK